MADFTFFQSGLIRATLTNNNPFQSQGVGHVNIRVFFDNNFQVLHLAASGRY